MRKEVEVEEHEEVAACIIHMHFHDCTVVLSGGEVDIAGDKSVKGARSVIEGARSLIEGATSNIQGAITNIDGQQCVSPMADGLPHNYPRSIEVEE